MSESHPDPFSNDFFTDLETQHPELYADLIVFQNFIETHAADFRLWGNRMQNIGRYLTSFGNEFDENEIDFILSIIRDACEMSLIQQDAISRAIDIVSESFGTYRDIDGRTNEI